VAAGVTAIVGAVLAATSAYLTWRLRRRKARWWLVLGSAGAILGSVLLAAGAPGGLLLVPLTALALPMAAFAYWGLWLAFAKTYLAPAMVARKRNLPEKRAIFWINLLFGWAVYPWIYCMRWAYRTPPTIVVHVQAPQARTEVPPD
jgi:uncharacterized membrane protein YfcA